MKGNIQEARKRLGLTQQEVAEILGKPSRTYGAWERGERELNLEDAWEIARIFKCSLDYLSGLITYEEEVERQRQNEILNLLKGLSAEGQEKVAEFCKDIAGNPKYKKNRREEPL